MSQHDYVIDDADGATFLGDLNNLLAAVVSANSGATAPATTYAYQMWADTTSGWLKQRNAANSAWIRRWPLGTNAAVDIASATTLDLDANAANSGIIRVTGTTATTAITLAEGQVRTLRAAAAWPITHGASLLCPGSASYTCAAGDLITAIGEAAGVVRLAIAKADGTAVVASAGTPPVRQTVLSGPVTSAGLPDFGGSTGSTTVTASGTLKATAAAGGDANYTGSISNPSWTGLSTNGTMYLYLEITAAGVVSTGSTTLAPTYQWGGSYSTTSGQHTYNIQEGTLKAGNGASASQVYRVFVGEVTVAGGSVTAITWYAIQGRYVGPWVTPLPAALTQITANHHIGTLPSTFRVKLLCLSADLGYAADEVYSDPLVRDSTGTLFAKVGAGASRLSIFGSTGYDYGGSNKNFVLSPKTPGIPAAPIASSWSYRFEAERGW